MEQVSQQQYSHGGITLAPDSFGAVVVSHVLAQSFGRQVAPAVEAHRAPHPVALHRHPAITLDGDGLSPPRDTCWEHKDRQGTLDTDSRPSPWMAKASLHPVTLPGGTRTDEGH